eukprot:Clim_evm20s14 gene=Clim_evmTU20s14
MSRFSHDDLYHDGEEEDQKVVEMSRETRSSRHRDRNGGRTRDSGQAEATSAHNIVPDEVDMDQSGVTVNNASLQVHREGSANSSRVLSGMDAITETHTDHDTNSESSRLPGEPGSLNDVPLTSSIVANSKRQAVEMEDSNEDDNRVNEDEYTRRSSRNKRRRDNNNNRSGSEHSASTSATIKTGATGCSSTLMAGTSAANRSTAAGPGAAANDAHPAGISSHSRTTQTALDMSDMMAQGRGMPVRQQQPQQQGYLQTTTKTFATPRQNVVNSHGDSPPEAPIVSSAVAVSPAAVQTQINNTHTHVATAGASWMGTDHLETNNAAEPSTTATASGHLPAGNFNKHIRNLVGRQNSASNYHRHSGDHEVNVPSGSHAEGTAGGGSGGKGKAPTTTTGDAVRHGSYRDSRRRESRQKSHRGSHRESHRDGKRESRQHSRASRRGVRGTSDRQIEKIKHNTSRHTSQNKHSGRRHGRHSGRSRSHDHNRRSKYDDHNDHYRFRRGETLYGKYKVRGLLGEGTFGQVVECEDRDRGGQVAAVKIIRSTPKYRDAAKIEVKILKDLKAANGGKHHYCVELLDWFDYRGHICIVFRRLGLSIFDFLKQNEFKPYLVEHIQAFAHQLFTAIDFMHRTHYIHTDLKPENILLMSSEALSTYHPKYGSYRRLLNPEIRLIDFGSTHHERSHHSSVVSTRHYRAPEIMLGLGWSYPCDLWSIGCILIELYTGHVLFQTHDNLEHLAMMQKVIGPIPEDIVEACPKTKYFSHRRLRWPNSDVPSSSIKFINAQCHPLFEYKRENGQVHDDLIDLLSKLLQFNPRHRLSAREALEHPFCRSLSPSS